MSTLYEIWYNITILKKLKISKTFKVYKFYEYPSIIFGILKLVLFVFVREILLTLTNKLISEQMDTTFIL